jgi:predicted DNA-binding transcriptional regulator AlpA
MAIEDKQTATAETTPGFIDEKQLLARLPISRRTGWNWRNSGKIPYVKIGRRILYHWASVESALLRQQRGAE